MRNKTEILYFLEIKNIIEMVHIEIKKLNEFQ